VQFLKKYLLNNYEKRCDRPAAGYTRIQLGQRFTIYP
jgi:hypothetical protein